LANNEQEQQLMTLDPRTFTVKTSEAVAAAMQAAASAGHNELTPHHVLSELVKQNDTMVGYLLWGHPWMK
jgi:hypothetical protein